LRERKASASAKTESGWRSKGSSKTVSETATRHTKGEPYCPTKLSIAFALQPRWPCGRERLTGQYARKIANPRGWIAAIDTGVVRKSRRRARAAGSRRARTAAAAPRLRRLAWIGFRERANATTIPIGVRASAAFDGSA